MKKKSQKNKSIVAATSKIPGQPYYIAVLALWCVYFYLTFTAPIDSTANQLNLSRDAINLLRISILIPYLLIWLAAVYSFVKIKRYAVAIAPSRESNAFENIAGGVLILLISLILSPLLSSLRTLFADYADLRPILTILIDYSYVLPYLLAFIFFFRGAIVLTRQQADSAISVTKYVIFGLPLILLAYVWLELIFTNPNRMTAGEASKFASYYLPDSLLVLTIVLPSLVTWIIGILTLTKLRAYYKKVKGTLYRNALSSLVYGFVGVILCSIILQALLSLGPQRLLDLGLVRLLEVIYFFVFIQAAGFFLIARGANKLTKIEEV